MKTISQRRRTKSKRTWIIILVILIAAAGGYGYFHWTRTVAAQAAAATETNSVNTSLVRRGSITLSASGSGTLAAGQENSLAFSAAGTVAEVDVQVGDVVKADQVLAKLVDMDTLQANVTTAQQELVSATQELDTLKQGAAANLANAQLDVVNAQKALDTAKAAVVQKGWVRCDQKTLDAYYYQYMHAQDQLNALGDGGGHADYYLNIIVPAKNAVARAKAAYEYCAGYTDYEVSSSEAELSLSEAKLKQAQDTLAELQQNNGLNPLDLATAENKVDNAQMSLDQAKQKLDGATLKAPYDGTILSVAGSAGDSVGTSTFITVADLAHPQVDFSIDETDLDMVYVGEPATISFDAMPNQTFKGTVTRINPALQSSGGYQVVTGLITLDLSQEKDLPLLPKGLNASVELVKASAQNVLVVPVQALRDLGDGSYAVFLVGADDKLTMKVVEVGLQDAASAEIKSGLKQGDVVSTGLAQTK